MRYLFNFVDKASVNNSRLLSRLIEEETKGHLHRLKQNIQFGPSPAHYDD